jgi:hypothetical protein
VGHSRQIATAEAAAAAAAAAAAEEPAADAAPGGAGFATTWDQSTFSNAQFPTAMSARALDDYGGPVSVFGGAALPARGRHAWTVAFAPPPYPGRGCAAGGYLGGYTFAGVVERKAGDRVAIPAETGAYGLRDGGDKHALRVAGQSKGAVRPNAHGEAFSRGDSITCVADMDARPRSLTLHRNAEPEPLGTVAGFGAEVYICAACWARSECELVLSFGGGPV